MGKFVEEKSVINTYLDNYVNTTSDFSRFIEGSPNFVTYYSKDVNASTEDIHLGGVMETIGTESPIKYNKIDNFPIYNMEEINPNITLDEDSGLDTTIESTAVILPNTIKPLPNDYFLIDYLNKKYLFRISNVETSNINNRVFYKITYFISGDSLDILEEHQLTDKYKVVYENLGKEAKSVIKESDFLLLDKLDDIHNMLKTFYIKRFYNPSFNTFLYNGILYDNYLMRFIAENELFIKTRTFMKNIKIEQALKEDVEEFMDYDNTLFSAVQNQSIAYLDDFYYVPEPVKEPASIFALYKNRYNINKIVYTTDSSINPFPFFSNNLYSAIEDNKLIDSSEEEYMIKNFIIGYLNKNINKDELVEYLEKYKPSLTLTSYLLLPCILFIIKEIENNILNK